MTLSKMLIFTTIALLCAIALVVVFKDKKKGKKEQRLAPVEVHLEQRPVLVAAHNSEKLTASHNPEKPKEIHENKTGIQPTTAIVELETNADRIRELFNTDGPKLPIVETITYKSRVDWQKGRPAWLSDYARHYQTSRHFIARSLNGNPEYFKQEIAEGDSFNVLRKDQNIQFHLLVDLSTCKMRLYYDLPDNKERVLLKTYSVGLGRMDESKASGFLTPFGKYTLGNKIAIYKPKMMGYHNGDQIEMIGTFGTRWIPFDKEVGECSAPAKGLGIHGLPWTATSAGEKVQDRSSIGKYQSDGCIRLASEDMEELFAIIITKPTTIELVNAQMAQNKK